MRKIGVQGKLAVHRFRGKERGGVRFGPPLPRFVLGAQIESISIAADELSQLTLTVSVNMHDELALDKWGVWR